MYSYLLILIILKIFLTYCCTLCSFDTLGSLKMAEILISIKSDTQTKWGCWRVKTHRKTRRTCWAERSGASSHTLSLNRMWLKLLKVFYLFSLCVDIKPTGSPLGPVDPCGPVRPRSPFSPCSPGGPIRPMRPWWPFSPFAPGSPRSPGRPGGPCRRKQWKERPDDKMKKKWKIGGNTRRRC